MTLRLLAMAFGNLLRAKRRNALAGGSMARGSAYGQDRPPDARALARRIWRLGLEGGSMSRRPPSPARRERPAAVHR